MTIAIILGTRPEIIKMAPVIRRPYRKLGMKDLDVATNVAGGVSVTDSQRGFRAYGRRTIESIYIKDSGMSAGSEVLLHAKDAQELNIILIYLSPYSPDLNPIEFIWKSINRVLSISKIENRKELTYILKDAFFGLIANLSVAKFWIPRFLYDKLNLLCCMCLSQHNRHQRAHFQIISRFQSSRVDLSKFCY